MRSAELSHFLRILTVMTSIWLGLPAWTARAAPAPEGQAIAILPFDSLSSYSSHDWMRSAFPEVLAVKLTGTSGTRFLDGQAVAAAFRGTAEVAPHQTDAALAQQVGQKLGADVVLFGEIDKRASQLTLHLLAIRVSDQKQLLEQRRTGVFEEPWPLLTELARAILKDLELSPGTGQEARIEGPAARDRYTLTLFGRGLNDLYGVSGPVNLDGAKENLQRSLRIDPTNAMIYNALGRERLLEGKQDEAGASFYEALKAWPDYPNVRREMARLSEDRKQYDEAIQHLRSVLSVEPSDLRGHFDLARLLSLQQKVRPALDEVTRVVDSPASGSLLAPALKLQAQLRASNADLAGMAESFRELLEVDPHSREARLGLGGYSLRRGAMAEAEAQFKALAAQDPKDPLPAHYLGEIALMRGDTEAAIAGFRQEGGTRASHWSAWSYLGEVYRRAGRRNKEIDAEGMAQVRASKNPIPLNNLAVARYRAAEYGTAVSLLRQAIELAPGWALLHQNLGIVLVAQGQKGRALASLEVAVELEPNLPAAQYQLGILKARLGDLEGAKVAFQAAVAADPHLGAAFYNLAGVLEALGDKTAAVKALQSYLEISPREGDLERVKGRIARLK